MFLEENCGGFVDALQSTTCLEMYEWGDLVRPPCKKTFTPTIPLLWQSNVMELVGLHRATVNTATVIIVHTAGFEILASLYLKDFFIC